jgi:Flp pilus assembly protein TadD
MLRILKRSFTATRTAYKAADGMIDNSSNRLKQNHSQIDETTNWNGAVLSLPLEDLLTMLRQSKTREDAISVEALVWLIYMSHDDVQVAKLMRLGVSEMKRGLHSKAFDYFLKAVTIDPLYAEAHNKLAALHHKIGEHEECARRANFALALLPCHYGALAGLGMAQESRNDRIASERALRKALQIHPWASHVPTILGTLARSQSSSPSDSAISHEQEPTPPV